MSLLTNVHAENKSERKLSIFIFNVIIFIAAFFILVFYATQPFFSINAKANLTKENLTELIHFDDETISVEDALPEELSLELTLTVSADTIFDTAAKVLNSFIFHFNTDVDLSEFTNQFVDENVNSLVDQFLPVLEDVALNVAKQLTVRDLKNELLSALKVNHSDSTDEELQALLDDTGVTDEFIEQEMDIVIDALTQEGAKLEDVSQTVVSVMHDVFVELNDDEQLAETFDEEALASKVTESLETFADEEGNIDVHAAIAELLNNALINLSPEEETASAKSSGVALLSTEAESTEDDSVAELKENLRETLKSKLPESFHDSFANALKWASLVLVLSMASWIYLMIKIIVKLFMKDNSVKLKAPIILGGIPGLFWLVPSVAMHFIGKNPETLALPYSLSLDFFASGWLALMGVLVLLIISGPYASLRKGLNGKKLRKVR